MRICYRQQRDLLCLQSIDKLLEFPSYLLHLLNSIQKLCGPSESPVNVIGEVHDTWTGLVSNLQSDVTGGLTPLTSVAKLECYLCRPRGAT